MKKGKERVKSNSSEDEFGSQTNDGIDRKDNGRNRSTFPKGKGKDKKSKSPVKEEKEKEKVEELPEKRFTITELEAPPRV